MNTEIDSRTAPEEVDDRTWARKLHDVTHEVELLISGATLFGLAQVPGRMDRWFDTIQLTMDGSMWTATFVAWYYTKLIVYTLIISFSLHLVSRAYWAGLIGLDSVFPEGVDWSRIEYGPQATRVYKEDVQALSTMARRADQFCSSIFSFAFWIVLVFGVSIVMGGGVGLVSLGVSALSDGAVPAAWVFFPAIGVLAGLPVLAVAVDKLLGARIPEEGVVARFLRRSVRAGYRVIGGGLFLPVQLVLFSRVPKRVMWTLYLGALVLLVTVFNGVELTRSGNFVVSASAVFPSRPGVRSVDARYFAATRTPGSVAPFIQSEIIEGPYVRLEQPLYMRRLGERIVRACPDAPALGEVGLNPSRSRHEPPDHGAMDEALACLATLWTVTLDGAPVDGFAWDFRSAPGVGVTSLVAYIPTAGLEPGAHVLAVEEVPDPEAGDEPEDRPRRHYIRFRI